MRTGLESPHGFSLTELMLAVAISTTLMAIAVPVVTDINQNTKLNEAARMVERELQTARLRAVNVNRPLRVRLNCPAAPYLRTVEVVGGAVDTSVNRCLESVFPYPAADQDLMTTPNYDGPLHMLPAGATVTDAVIDFEPDGTAFLVVAGVPQNISAAVSITITRGEKFKTVTVNGAGKIQLN